MAATPPNAANPRAQARASVRAKIAQSVFTIFAERGFEETTATEAAEAAGISRASFFRYFSSKEEAVFAAQEAMGEEIAAFSAAVFSWAERGEEADLIELIDQSFGAIRELIPR
jgi:AcrR family transcriptional regulator